MTMFKRLLLACCTTAVLLVASAFADHKFYFSNVSVFINPRTQITECTIKLFYDDIELALTQKTGKKIQFHQQANSEISPYLSEYLAEHFSIAMDNNAVMARWVGYEMEGDLVICYIEYPYPAALHALEVKSDVLVAQFPDQKNVVQVEYNGSTQTILLDKNKTTQTVFY